MPISSWYSKLLKQTAVYWAPPEIDGLGGVTFAAPVEISSNWEERPVTTYGQDGTEITARTSVWINEDVEIGGYLFLGSISDADGKEVQDIASQIVNFTMIWSIITKAVYSRRAFLL